MKKLSAFVSVVLAFCFMSLSVCAYDISETSAKGAVVIDAKTGEVLFSHNENDILPMASTTKIMTVMLTLENGNLDEKFVVDSEAVKVEGSSMGLREGDTVTLRDLCYGMLLPSGNDAANCAAARVAGSVEKFVEMMNAKANELGLDSTHFVTPSGLDDYTDEHYSTAKDMAMLTRAAMENETFCEMCSADKAQVCFGNPPFKRWLINTNRLLKSCDGVCGVKTGFTDKAKRCLVSACKRNGTKLICVTLNDPDDWQDHEMLYNYCFSFYEEQELPLINNTFVLNVAGGKKDTVKCITGSAKSVLLKGKAEEVTSVVHLPRFVYAPVADGQRVGKVEYYYKGVKIEEKGIFTSDCVYSEKNVNENVFLKIKNRIVDLIVQ